MDQEQPVEYSRIVVHVHEFFGWSGGFLATPYCKVCGVAVYMEHWRTHLKFHYMEGHDLFANLARVKEYL